MNDTAASNSYKSPVVIGKALVLFRWTKFTIFWNVRNISETNEPVLADIENTREVRPAILL